MTRRHLITVSWLVLLAGYPFVYPELIAVGWHYINIDGIGLVGNKERFARLAIACETFKSLRDDTSAASRSRLKSRPERRGV
jgi:hypothetical protein